MKIKVIVTLKSGVLDPQGKAIQQTLNGMGFANVKDVRQGKYFDIDIDENDEQKAKLSAEEICKKLLANQVIEDFKVGNTHAKLFGNTPQTVSPPNLIPFNLASGWGCLFYPQFMTNTNHVSPEVI